MRQTEQQNVTPKEPGNTGNTRGIRRRSYEPGHCVEDTKERGTKMMRTEWHEKTIQSRWKYQKCTVM